MFFIQTRDEIEEQERTILDLEAAVKAKEAPLKLAETRLENRDISHSLDSVSYEAFVPKYVVSCYCSTRMIYNAEMPYNVK